MNDDAFWKRIEEEVLPYVKKKHVRHERYFVDKLNEVKTLDFEKNYELAYHQWMTLGCYLRTFYWEGLQIKFLIEHCCIKCGKDPTHITL